MGDIHRRLRAQQTTCEELVECFIQRIVHNDMDASTAPALNAFVSLHPHVRERARILDQAFQHGGFVGPLHGVPVLIKDTIDVAGMPTSLGTLALKDCLPAGNAFLVSKLLEAGAIVLGKTTVDELASGCSARSSRSGIARNSYDTTKNASGSSSGSAIGVSANFGVLAVGADAQCSIRSPASYNGVVGMRPTPGLISRSGTIDGFSPETAEAVYGPLARTVADLAQLLDVIAKPDRADAATLDPYLPRPRSYADLLEAAGAVRLSVGVLRSYGSKNAWGADHPEMVSGVTRRAHAAIIDDLRSLGVRVVDPIHFEDFVHLRGLGGTSSPIDTYLQSLNAPYASIVDVLNSGLVLPRSARRPAKGRVASEIIEEIARIHADEALSSGDRQAALMEAMTKLVCKAGKVTTASWDEVQRVIDANLPLKRIFLGPDGCKRHKAKTRSALEALMDHHRVDVLVYPETPYGPAYPNAASDGVLVTGYNAGLGTVTGMPSIVVPGGYGTLPDGCEPGESAPRPFGVEFMSRRYEDVKLLQIAYAYEQRTMHRKPPLIGGAADAAGLAGRLPPADIEKFNAFKLEAAEALFNVQCSRTDLRDSELALELRRIINSMNPWAAC